MTDSPLPTDAAARKRVQLATALFDYFPAALCAIAECAVIANDQHNPGEPVHWARTKSTDHADCLLRHFLDRGRLDTDGVRHSTKVAIRALMALQLELEAAGSAPVALTPRPIPGALCADCGANPEFGHVSTCRHYLTAPVAVVCLACGVRGGHAYDCSRR